MPKLGTVCMRRGSPALRRSALPGSRADNNIATCCPPCLVRWQVAVPHTIVFSNLSLRYIELGDDGARPAEVTCALSAPLTLSVQCRDAQWSTGASRAEVVDKADSKEWQASWGETIELECALTRSRRTGEFFSKDVRLVAWAKAGITGCYEVDVSDAEIDLVDYVARTRGVARTLAARYVSGSRRSLARSACAVRACVRPSQQPSTHAYARAPLPAPAASPPPLPCLPCLSCLPAAVSRKWCCRCSRSLPLRTM